MIDALKFNSQRYSMCPGNTGDEVRIQKLMSLVGSNRRVLDVGCLDGTVGQMLMRNGNHVCGIDASSVAIAHAKEKGVDARVGDLEQGIGFPEGIFDVVLAGEIIEHVFNVEHFLSEIHRVLVSDGALVMSTPNLAALGRRLLLLFNRNPHIETTSSGEAAGHIRYFVRDTLFRLLKDQHFAVEVFTSDEVNLSATGSLRLTGLASWCPSLGRSLIVRARKI